MNWRRVLVASGAAVPLLALLFFGMGRDPRAIPSPLPGRAAPEFALEVMPRTEGPVHAAVANEGASAEDTVRLTDLRGHVVVLNFWASWCLACRDEHAALSRTAEEYADRPVRFFGVLYNDSPPNARRWIAAMGGQSYPTLLDPGSVTAIDYGLYGVPETFFVAPDGTVAYKHIGPVTAELLREKIDGLLATAAGTPTLGDERERVPLEGVAPVGATP